MATQYPPAFYRVSAKAIIFSGDRLVLMKEDQDAWELPGGGIEHRETLEQAFEREITEETGATLETVDLTKVEPWLMYDERDDRPLLQLVARVTTKQSVQAGMFGDVEIGLFTREQMDSIELAPFAEKHRAALIAFAFG
ncbi:MAG: NUDIX domain-containing protein [Candidatus Saccharibacteria bacterium]